MFITLHFNRAASRDATDGTSAPSLPPNAVAPLGTPVAVLANSPSAANASSGSLSGSVTSAMDNVVMPSGTTIQMMPPAGAASSGPSSTSTAVVPVNVAGIGVGFPMPHPGDGSMDFSKTEMVTPETSLNMSVAAFLAR